MGGIGVLWKFRIAKIVLFNIQDGSYGHIDQKLDGRHLGDMEIQNC